MSNRFPTSKPTTMVGSTILSGLPNTGQVLFTQGGSVTFSKLSGTAGGNAMIFTGAGRLDSIHYHPSAIPAASGFPLLFYDAASALSGHGASGYTILDTTNTAQFGSVFATFNSGVVNIGGDKQVGRVFQSGLAFQSQSGQAGFTVSYTPVQSGGGPNP